MARTRAERRQARVKAIKHGEKLMKDLGQRGGRLFERHREKIDKSGGYFEGGSISHYVATKPSKKVREKNRYGKSENWSPRDIRQKDSGVSGIDSLLDDNDSLEEETDEAVEEV
jgi:hypothetical protein